MQPLDYVSFSSGDLEASGKRYPIDVKMIAPFSDEVMKVTGLNGKGLQRYIFTPLMILVAPLKVMPVCNQARI
ncbi:hypothetical protein ACLB1M_04385 [Escherichia coli]